MIASEAPPSPSPPPARKTHFEGFDGLRAIAALSVVGLHVGTVSFVNRDHWMGQFTSHLNVGVTIFFVISGFLLYRPYAMALLWGSRPPALGRYAIRRFLRIVPAYWVALTLLAIWPGLRGVWTADWWIYYGFLQAYDPVTTTKGLGVAWSLDVEVAFYLALPFVSTLLVALASRGPGDRRFASAAIAIAALAVAAVGFRLFAKSIGSWPLLMALPSFFFWFCLGMGLALLSARVGDREEDHPLTAFIGRHPAACWAAAGLVYVGMGLAPAIPRQPPAQPLLHALYHVLLGVIAALVVLPGALGEKCGGWPRRLLASRPMAWIGTVSYGVFLWHLPLLKAIAHTPAYDWVGGRPFPSLWITIVPLSLLAGWLSYVLVERPAIAWGRRNAIAVDRRPPAS